MIKAIMIFDNSMVAVFNDKGKQIPSLQGDYMQNKQVLMYLMKKYPFIKVEGNIHQRKTLEPKEWPFYFPWLMGFLELEY